MKVFPKVTSNSVIVTLNVVRNCKEKDDRNLDQPPSIGGSIRRISKKQINTQDTEFM